MTDTAELKPVAWRWTTWPHTDIDGDEWPWTLTDRKSTIPSYATVQPLYTSPTPESRGVRVTDEMMEAEARAEVIRQLCGTDLNGGFIRDLCFTVWSICHNPTHEDGNADWGSDTLPTVQVGVAKVREALEAARNPEQGETP